jgi:hypothetical protein
VEQAIRLAEEFEPSEQDEGLDAEQGQDAALAPGVGGVLITGSVVTAGEARALFGKAEA